MVYQVVILTNSEDSCWANSLGNEPLCCSSVCNKPLLWSLLENLAEQLRDSVNLIFTVDGTSQADVKTCVEQALDAGLQWKGSINYVEVPPSKQGLLDVIPYVTSHLTTLDVLFLPANLYGPLPFMSLYELHKLRKKNASHTLSLMMAKRSLAKEHKVLFDPPHQFIIAREDSFLLSLASFPDAQFSHHHFTIPFSNLAERGNEVKIDKSFYNLNVYLLDFGLLDVLAMIVKKYHFSSFTWDALPFLTTMQSSMTLLGLPPLTVLGLPVVSGMDYTTQPIVRVSHVQQYRILNLYVSRVLTTTSSQEKRLGGANKVSGMPYSVATMHSADRKVKISASLTQHAALKVKRSGLESRIAILVVKGALHKRVGVFVLIHENYVLYSGPRCKIGTQVTLVQSVIQHDANIGSRVSLFECLICHGAVVEEDTHLTNCIVASKQHIPSGKYSGRVFCSTPLQET